MKTRIAFVVALMILAPRLCEGAELKLLASAALKAAYLEVLPQFESASGHKVIASWSSSQVIQKRIAEGEDADVVVMADVLGRSLTDELISRGKLTAGSAVLAKSGVGVAVRAGAPKPDIGSADAVKATILAARTVAYSAGASGTYIATMLTKMGIYEQVKSKAVTVRPSEPVGEVVARGDAEIGFHQVSELLPVSGIDFLGPLPSELQNITVYSGAVRIGTTNPDPAGELVKFLASPALAPALRKHGLEPG